MPEFIQIWFGGRAEILSLDGPRTVVGRTEENSIVLNDPSVSRVHAVFERVGSAWTIKDLGSRNGTLVNDVRVTGEIVLHDGDEIRIGNSRLVFQVRGQAVSKLDRTVGAAAPPELTRREREVLIALCRSGGGSVFRAPAPIKEVAASLHVTEAAIKQHLSRLYDKFELEAGPNRRSILANEALRRGAVSLADVEA